MKINKNKLQSGTKREIMVSIIIACYNHQEYIKESLDSILDDSYKNKEIVIINDGSPDNSHKVISQWIEKNTEKINITYINRENKGLNKTLNELVSLSAGKYIIMMDSDDYLIDGGIEKRVNYLKSNLCKDAVFCDSSVVDKQSNLTHKSQLFEYRGYKKEEFKNTKNINKTILKRFAIAGPILMVRKELYTNVGLYDENLCVEDLDFYLRVIAQNKLGFLDEVVCAYRIHGANASIENNTASFLKVLKDGRKSFIKNFHLFSFSQKLLAFWQIIKFSLREWIFYIKLKMV